MNIRTLLFWAGMTIGTAVSASQGPELDYSADSSMETADMSMHGKIYHSRDKERREYEQDGTKQIMIVRHDRKVIWMLMPDDSVYMEMKMVKDGRSDDLGSYKMKTTRVGSETINGVKTTKSKVIMTGARGVKMGGFIWTSKEGITVKLDAISVEKSSRERFKIELKNLHVGKQDPSLFEIPAGYTRMDMGGMRNMLGGGGNSNKQQQGKKEGGGFGLKDALDLLK